MENQENKMTKGEGDAMGYIVVLDDANCAICGKCIPACPNGVFKMVNKMIVIKNNSIDCDGCSECIDACMYDAIEVRYPHQK